MRITFVIPFVNLTGGIRAVLDFAGALHRGGHTVTVVYPAWPYRFHFTRRQQFQEFRLTMARPPRVAWTDTDVDVHRVPLIRNSFLPPADVVVATSWPTTYDVARLSDIRGRKVQLLMHDESDTGSPMRVRRTFRLPFHRLTISRAVARELTTLGCEIADVVSCGVNTRTFFPDGAPESRTVMMVYHPEPRKGARAGFAALARVRERFPGTRVRVCGTVPVDGLPEWTDTIWNPRDDALRRMYSTSTVFLYPSRYEGFGLPPLEAMACGCPVVSTTVGAVPDYAIDGQSALLVPPEDHAAMAARIGDLLSMPVLRQQLSDNGLRTAAEYSIDTVAPTFERALERAARCQDTAVQVS